MPSLSGWLLGYPVAYLVDAANVGAAASWLSSADLALHSVIIACPLLQVRIRNVPLWTSDNTCFAFLWGVFLEEIACCHHCLQRCVDNGHGLASRKL